MEGSDRELELVGMINHGLKVGNSVAVGVDVNLSTESCAQGLPENLLRQVLIHTFHTQSFGLVTPVVLLAIHLARPLESMAEFIALAHAAIRPVSNTAMGALGIFTTGHLHVAPVALRVSQHIGCGDFLTTILLSDGMLEEEGLSTDVVAGAWENERRGDTTGFNGLDLRVKWVDAVNGASPGRDVIGHFIRV